MKISKLLPAVCVFAFCVSFAQVRAQDNPAQAAARAALLKQQQASAPQTPPPAPVAPAMTTVAAPTPVVIIAQTNAPVAQAATVKKPAPAPVVAPALPITFTKDQRLQVLLAKYKADQITPEQYHKLRATILAEP